MRSSFQTLYERPGWKMHASVCTTVWEEEVLGEYQQEGNGDPKIWL